VQSVWKDKRLLGDWNAESQVLFPYSNDCDQYSFSNSGYVLYYYQTQSPSTPNLQDKWITTGDWNNVDSNHIHLSGKAIYYLWNKTTNQASLQDTQYANETREYAFFGADKWGFWFANHWIYYIRK
jgi:hypothetical protein